MEISIIAAKAENNVIGKDNQLIWHLPADLKFFKSKTSGHHIIMGRKTFESIGKALPNRTTVIITRNKDYRPPVGCLVCNSLNEAFEIAKKNGETEAFITGGSEIYKLGLEEADKLYITEVKAVFDGDTYFPEIDKTKWAESDCFSYQPDEKNKYAYDFVEYSKR